MVGVELGRPCRTAVPRADGGPEGRGSVHDHQQDQQHGPRWPGKPEKQWPGLGAAGQGIRLVAETLVARVLGAGGHIRSRSGCLESHSRGGGRSVSRSGQQAPGSGKLPEDCIWGGLPSGVAMRTARVAGWCYPCFPPKQPTWWLSWVFWALAPVPGSPPRLTDAAAQDAGNLATWGPACPEPALCLGPAVCEPAAERS